MSRQYSPKYFGDIQPSSGFHFCYEKSAVSLFTFLLQMTFLLCLPTFKVNSLSLMLFVFIMLYLGMDFLPFLLGIHHNS